MVDNLLNFTQIKPPAEKDDRTNNARYLLITHDKFKGQSDVQVTGLNHKTPADTECDVPNMKMSEVGHSKLQSFFILDIVHVIILPSNPG